MCLAVYLSNNNVPVIHRRAASGGDQRARRLSHESDGYASDGSAGGRGGVSAGSGDALDRMRQRRHGSAPSGNVPQVRLPSFPKTLWLSAWHLSARYHAVGLLAADQQPVQRSQRQRAGERWQRPGMRHGCVPAGPSAASSKAKRLFLPPHTMAPCADESLHQRGSLYRLAAR